MTVARLTGIATPEMFDSTAEWIVRYVAPDISSLILAVAVQFSKGYLFNAIKQDVTLRV